MGHRFAPVPLYVGLLLVAGCGPADAPRTPPLPGHLQADFDPSAGLVVGVTQMIQHHPQTLVSLARATRGEAPLIGLLGQEPERPVVRKLLADHGVPREHVTLVTVPMQTMWLRDFGPLVARDADGSGIFLDGIFRGTENNPDDDGVPAALARVWNVQHREIALEVDGGMVLSNGRGLVLLATSVLQRHARQGEGQEAINRRIQSSLPATEFILVQPLPDEPTAHLDVFLALVVPDLCVLSSYDPERVPRLARHVDAVERRLAGHPTLEGPLRVERVPTPPPRDGAWFSYTNVVQIGNLVLVPTYGQVDDEWNQTALATYRRLLPGREIRGVDSTTVIQKHGAIRCVSFTLPEGVAMAGDPGR